MTPFINRRYTQMNADAIQNHKIGNRRASASICGSLLLVVFLSLYSTARAEVQSEFIWADAPFPSAHASTIVETREGALISAWFGGTDEGEPDVGIWSSRKEPGGAWTAPVELFKEPKQPAWNPVLFRNAEGAIWLFAKTGPTPEQWTGLSMKSTDSGKTWGPVRWLQCGMLGPVRAKPITLASGAIVAGTAMESYKAWSSWMEISEDGGETWKKYGPLSFGDMEKDRKGTIQPTLMEIRPGVIRAMMRTRGMGKIATAISQDGGKNWGPITLTKLDHPSVGIDTVRLKDGRCLLIYNPSVFRRTPISLAISYDDGETWKDFLKLDELKPGEEGELSYPAMIQSDSGDIHITYTWNRKRIKHARVPLADVPKKP